MTTRLTHFATNRMTSLLRFRHQGSALVAAQQKVTTSCTSTPAAADSTGSSIHRSTHHHFYSARFSSSCSSTNATATTITTASQTDQSQNTHEENENKREQSSHNNTNAATKTAATAATTTNNAPPSVTITHSQSSDSSPFIHTNSESMELVDSLLQRTSEMMDPSAANVVAYSGGVDSSLVAALVYRCFSDYDTIRNNAINNKNDKTNNNSNNHHPGSVQAVLGISPAVPQTQIHMARTVAQFIGIPLIEVTTAEGSDEAYVRNDGHACFVCKTHLYSTLQHVAGHIMEQQQQQQQQQNQQPRGGNGQIPNTINNNNNNNNNNTHTNDNNHKPIILYNGTNANDTTDPTRLGLHAAANFLVRSPLSHITKDQVRQASRYLSLPNWNAAASPCLRSRLAMGVMATETHLKAVELAENYVRGVLDLDVNGRLNVRVRMLSGGRAVVELDEEVLLRHVRNQDDGDDGGLESILRRDGFESKCIEEWGFQSFGGVRSFKTGSVAAMPITTTANGNDGQLFSMASTTSVGM